MIGTQKNTMDTKAFKALIFDMDGLLLDTERLFMAIRAKVMADYGYIHRDEDYFRTIGTGGDNLMRILEEIYGSDYPAMEISRDARRLQLEHMREYGAPVKDGIRELLEWTAGKTIPCCVATSSPSAAADEYLRLGGIRDYFAFIIGGEEISRPKPDPEIFLTACDRMGVAPDEALVFEDSENGILAAHRAGTHIVCIPDLKSPATEIAGLADAVFHSAGEVTGWLSGQ